MKLLFIALLALSTIGIIFAQEPQSEFVGTWTDNYFGGNSVNICQVGNKIFGAFSIGFFEGQLEYDRLTVSGNIYFAGNTGEGNSGEFRITYQQTAGSGSQNFIGWIHTTDGNSLDWRADRISGDAPASQDSCWARDGSFDATIEGYYTSDSGDELHICLSETGFGYEFNLNDNVYSRGPTVEAHKAGHGQWWSEQNYGGVVFSLVDHDTLFVNTHTQDKSEVFEYGCIAGAGPTCTVERFRRRGVAAPTACRRSQQLSNFEGYWTFSPLNGVLRMRRRGEHVYGSWTYGVLEGQVNSDSTVLTGAFFTANWDDSSTDKVDYFGEFTIHIGPNSESFDGRWYLNHRGKCKLGDSCVTEWSEQRIELPHEVSAYDVYQISPNHFSTDGSNNVDGAYTLDTNQNVNFFLCRNRKRKYKENSDKPNPIKTDGEGRQRVTGTYTDFGTGGVKGSIRTDLELGSFESFEPSNSTMNGRWVDEYGFGTQIARKISETVLHEYWFLGKNEPDLAWCDFTNEINCGEIYWNHDSDATWEQCTYAQRRVGRSALLDSESDLHLQRESNQYDERENNEFDESGSSTVFIPTVFAILFSILAYFF